MAAMHGFNKGTLIGNWYEERVAVDQPVRVNPEMRNLRTNEESIAFIGKNNDLLPLGRVNRKLPWNTSGVIADYNYREQKTLKQIDYSIDRLKNYYNNGDRRNIIKTTGDLVARPEGDVNVLTSQVNDYKILRMDNIGEVIENPHPVKTFKSDFGSTLKRHDREHDRLYAMTSYNGAYSRPQKESAAETIKNIEKQLSKPAGFNSVKSPNEGLKMTSALTGEKLKEGADPKEDTRVQRAWLPQVDKAIEVASRNVERNDEANQTRGLSVGNDRMANFKSNTIRLPECDNANSLPLGDGVYSTKDKYWGDGNFRRIGTDVTRIRNKPFSRR
eukprot:TRINITY_DN3314_c0_g1_i1.p1 TRINITY_DN3314_c0_g1~~TRINITY_DN3314_c0_g1_i1.p1  ORF type:complete len:330 (-),score=53.73 TRINITY_DN3314_c0_g1_i1:148-1137(-)